MDIETCYVCIRFIISIIGSCKSSLLGLVYRTDVFPVREPTKSSEVLMQ